jgi:1-deoxy-D-xylulose-5-phosphate reductoisomerase
MRKRVAVLGSTGSIGTQTLDVIAAHPDRLEVVALAADRNDALLRQQAERFGVKHLALHRGNPDGDIPTGMDAVSRLATLDEVDIVVISVSGVIGLDPTVAAIQAGKAVALASKEVLVAAGEIIMPMVRDHNTTLTPIDSEHSAIFQCLQGYRADQVQELILTASGGPFRGRTRSELANISVEQALAHPTWRMGGKITIDSATLMNKGLETIEARWLFDVDIDQIEVVVHPQSVIHSMVKFLDGSVLGQLGWPDMRLPITYALLYPDRVHTPLRPWNPVDTPNLTFEAVDNETFPAINLAQTAVQAGGTAACVLNAANEEAANAFLTGHIGFLSIIETVDRTLQEHIVQPATFEQIHEADAWARDCARRIMKNLNE